MCNMNCLVHTLHEGNRRVAQKSRRSRLSLGPLMEGRPLECDIDTSAMFDLGQHFKIKSADGHILHLTYISPPPL